MKQITAVFRNQGAMFLRDKGMMVFYLLAALIIGVAVSIFSGEFISCLSIAAIMTATFLTPILADSMAGEREKKTLESLLSTAIKGSRVVWGKFLFAGLFAVVFFSLCAGIAVVTNTILGSGTGFSGPLWLCAGALALMNFTATVLGGLYQSALSGDTRVAYTRVSLIAFPMGIVYMVALTTLTMVEPADGLYVLALFLAIYAVVTILFTVMIVRLRQPTYFQKVRFSKRGHAQRVRLDEPRSQSQVSTVFAHEMRYVATLKMIMIFFLLLCAAPAIFCAIGYYYQNEVNLNYAVLITALMMPRTPTNLVAYSIGGEKTYKTAESLLSTPLHVKPMFVAKMLVPVVISAGMLILSSVLTLAGANVIGQVFESGTQYMYSIDQLVMIFPAGILSCISMVLITGVLSARMKKPRNGLYVSSVLGILFVIPPLCIVYLTSNHLLWSLAYCGVLLIANVIGFVKISGNISRPQLMSWI